MSITFNKTPKTIDFTGNGLQYIVQGNPYVVAPEIASIGVEIQSAISGAIQIYDFDKASLFTIDIVATPDPTKNEITAGTTSLGTLKQELNSLYQFNKYYYADLEYNYTLEEFYLKISTKKERFLNWDTGIVLPASITEYPDTQDNGADAEYKQDYTIYAQINKLVNAVPQIIAELECKPNIEGIIDINTADIIKSYVAHLLPDGAVDSNFIEQFVVYFAERYKDNGEIITTILTPDDFYATKGRFEKTAYIGYDLLEDFNTNKKFLNHFNQCDIFKGARYYLNFLNKTPGSYSAKIQCKIYYTDETDYTVEVNDIVMSGTPSVYYCIDASIDGLNLNSYYPSKEIYKYEVWLELQLSELYVNKFTFNVIEPPMYYKELAFLNKYGFIEIFHAISKEDISVNLEKNIVRKEDGTIEDTFIEAYNIFKISTGAITKEIAIEIQHMLLTEALYELIDDDYKKIIIEPGTIAIIENSADIVSIEFTYRRAYDL